MWTWWRNPEPVSVAPYFGCCSRTRCQPPLDARMPRCSRSNVTATVALDPSAARSSTKLHASTEQSRTEHCLIHETLAVVIGSRPRVAPRQNAFPPPRQEQELSALPWWKTWDRSLRCAGWKSSCNTQYPLRERHTLAGTRWLISCRRARRPARSLPVAASCSTYLVCVKTDSRKLYVISLDLQDSDVRQHW